MKHLNQAGDRLHKHIVFKIFHPSGRVEKKESFAPPGQGFTAETMEKALYSIGEAVERAYPEQRFSCVQVGAAQFNFICRGSIDPTAA